MKVAIVGSRSLDVNIDRHIPKETSLIISGGANGIDKLAEKYAKENNIPTLIIEPEYSKYRKNAPLVRNKKIVESADLIIAFWDGISNGTKDVINQANLLGKQIIVHNIVKRK